MIFTDCPYCNEPQAFGWDAGDPTGHFPSKCQKCGKVMWVEATALGGETISHENFMASVMKAGDEEKVRKVAQEAKVLGGVTCVEGLKKEGQPCPTCHGSGEAPVRLPPDLDKPVLCLTCHGTGKNPDHFDTSPCPTCKGSGRRNPTRSDPCPNCNGTGRNLQHADDGHADPCPRCNGSGDDPSSSIGLRFNCTACNGTGLA